MMWCYAKPHLQKEDGFMAFIKVQKLVRDENGKITSGSASIIDTMYDPSRAGHSAHITRERLGKVVYISEDRKSGIFESPTRGLVCYDSALDEFSDVNQSDPRIDRDAVFPEPQIHTVFGDSYLILNFLYKTGFIELFKTVFTETTHYERVLCHVVHSLVKDGSRITCDDFYAKSVISYILDSLPIASLKSDTAYFNYMGLDNVKMSFFKAYIAFMRKEYPNFGVGCYVDSTPLPNDIIDNPFNALCSHGVSCTEVMMRLVLILDEETGYPVWFDFIPGNELDINTLRHLKEDVEGNLGITINSYVLDAGYISKELIQEMVNTPEKTFLGRMPARKGFPFHECYNEVKDYIGKGKYCFLRNGHTYFGKKLKKVVFDSNVFLYVYVDEHNALRIFHKFLVDHNDDFEKMKDKDKNWQRVKGGFFVLISNRDDSIENILIDYYGRTEIESVFKTSKEYLDLLPLSKWTNQTVRGKVLSDVICTIILLTFRKIIGPKDKGLSVTEILGKASSQMCSLVGGKRISIETGNKQTKEMYKILGVKPAASLDLEQTKKRFLP